MGIMGIGPIHTNSPETVAGNLGSCATRISSKSMLNHMIEAADTKAERMFSQRNGLEDINRAIDWDRLGEDGESLLYRMLSRLED